MQDMKKKICNIFQSVRSKNGSSSKNKNSEIRSIAQNFIHLLNTLRTVGIEPTTELTNRFTVCRISHSATPSLTRRKGIEPIAMILKTSVLPLNYLPCMTTFKHLIFFFFLFWHP